MWQQLLPCAALLGVLGATIVSFHEVSPTAAYLLVPYFGWSAFAAVLTANIYAHNPRVSPRGGLQCCSTCTPPCQPDFGPGGHSIVG